MTADFRTQLVAALRDDVLTEENTDKLIEFIFEKIDLPWWIPGALVRKVLDKLLPNVLLDALVKITYES